MKCYCIELKTWRNFFHKKINKMDEGVDVERTATDWTDIGEEKPLSGNSQRLERFG